MDDFIFLDLFNYLSVLILLVFILIYAWKDSFLMIVVSMEFMVLVVLGLIFCFELNNFNEWVFLYYLIFPFVMEFWVYLLWLMWFFMKMIKMLESLI